MKIARVETIPVSVPYRHRELSSQVARDGVSDVLVKLTTDDGLVGWGEACCGADTASIDAALHAMAPFVLGRDPWNRDAMRRDAFTHGLWQFRAGTGNFAWAGIDMALWDICGRTCGQPLWRLLGGVQQREATYFYYLARGPRESLAAQVAEGRAAGFEVFYLKVGLDDAEDLAMVAATREALGAGPRLRLDANGSWSLPQAVRNLQAFEEHDIDFVEQPVRDHPIGQLAALRARTTTTLCANEGLWSEADAYARIRARQAEIYCFSQYWVGSIGSFHRLAWVAEYEGLQVCKHTHGELGLAAAAAHHVVLTLPNGVEGHQQTAHLMQHDVLTATDPDRERPALGHARRARARRGRRRGRRRRGGSPVPSRRAVPSLATRSAREGGTVTAGRLEGKVALVVGGGSGMGRAGAAAMAAEGAKVVVSDISLERAEAVSRSIVDSGGEAAAKHVDVTSSELVQRLVVETVELFGRLDALYHCAADVQLVNTQDRRLTELEDEIWNRVIDIHLTGTFHVLKHAGRQMLAQRSGSIIVSSTVDALVGCAGLDSYTAAKGGVTSLVRSFAAGVGRDGVRVNAIAPSFVSSESQRVWLDDEQARATIQSLHILPVPTPEQIAPFVVYLASDESTAVTGTVFPIDAGYMAFKAQVDVMGTMQAGY